MIEVLGIASLAFMIAHYGLVDIIKRVTPLNRVQPLDCPKCMGFWLGLGYAIYSGFSWEHTILHAAASSVIAILIELTLIRLRNG